LEGKKNSIKKMKRKFEETEPDNFFNNETKLKKKKKESPKNKIGWDFTNEKHVRHLNYLHNTTRQIKTTNIIQLRIGTLTGSIINLIVEDDILVYNLKEILFIRSGIEINRQKIIFNGKFLNDEKTLLECKIEDGTKLNLVFAV
jgi:hypothetical protein